jgi:prophage antirepressor-like protein
MNELVTVPHVFQFDVAPIRVFDMDGCRAAVASDICAALDIKDTTKAVAKLDEDDKWTLHRSDTPACMRSIWEQFAPQVQVVILVSEDGATDLILESRKPQARAFRRFLTHTVWPAIRDKGTYSVVPALEGEELMARAVLEAQKVIAAARPVSPSWNPRHWSLPSSSTPRGTYRSGTSPPNYSGQESRPAKSGSSTSWRTGAGSTATGVTASGGSARTCWRSDTCPCCPSRTTTRRPAS